MKTQVDQIADRIYRLSTCIPEVAPGGFAFNQFLVDSEEPLLYHTGMRSLFPVVREAVERVMPLDRLRWVAFAHVEAAECGAANDFLAAAPHAQVVHVSCDALGRDRCRPRDGRGMCFFRGPCPSRARRRGGSCRGGEQPRQRARGRAASPRRRPE